MTAFARLRTLARLHDLRDRPDADLLHLFADRRDEAAFELLVRRHGPLVLGVCRRALGDHAADDAFQATFLLLARRAPALREPAGLSRWLYGVAARVAREAQRQERRRRRREQRAARPEAVHLTHDDTTAEVDAAVRRLPEPYRTAVLLCDLGGFTRDQAAAELGVPAGTVASRVSRGRQLLAADLTRRGVTLGVLAAAVPAGLGESTARVAGLVAAGEAAPAAVLPLIAHGGRTMFGLKVVAAVLVLGGAAVVLPGGQKPAADLPKLVEVAPPPRPAETPAAKLARLKQEYQAEEKAHRTLTDTSPTGGQTYSLRPFDARKYLPPLAELAGGPDEAVAFDAAVFALEVRGRDGESRDAAITALIARYAKTPYAHQLGTPLINNCQDREATMLALAAATDDRVVAADSLFWAGMSLDDGRGTRFRGPEPGWMTANRAKAVAYYRRVIAEYPTERHKVSGHLAGRAREVLDWLERLRPGRPAPPTAGTDLTGKPLDLADFKGKTVVLHFWQPGPVGGREMAALTTLQDEYRDRGVVVLGVTGWGDVSPDRCRASAEERGAYWRSWYDPRRRDPSSPGPLHAAWGTASYPTCHIVAADGMIDAFGVGVDSVAGRLKTLYPQPVKP